MQCVTQFREISTTPRQTYFCNTNTRIHVAQSYTQRHVDDNDTIEHKSEKHQRFHVNKKKSNTNTRINVAQSYTQCRRVDVNDTIET